MTDLQNLLRVEISIRVFQLQNYGGGLELRQTLELKPRDFTELCGILAQFKELADKIKEDETK